MEKQATANGFTKKIGRAVYKVNVHFSENSKENFNDKLFRIIQNDIANNTNAVYKPRLVPDTAQGNTNPCNK